ncbi:hypothetical protein TNCV_1135031 [Trichonephila clavipes]|nr:hypothetical protein TNCV_1135031 [Trichonephila clavipes]
MGYERTTQKSPAGRRLNIAALDQCSATFLTLLTGQRLIILPRLAEGGPAPFDPRTGTGADHCSRPWFDNFLAVACQTNLPIRFRVLHSRKYLKQLDSRGQGDRAHVSPPSEEKTNVKITLRQLVFHQYGVALKSDTISRKKYSVYNVNGHLRSLLNETETSEKEIDQAREEPDEIMDIDNDSEGKLEKSDERESMKHLSRKENFQKVLKELTSSKKI